MQFIGIIKRVIPFFLTFAAGLFIASFFVTLSAPSFDGVRKNRSEKHRKHCEWKREAEQLRLENSLLKTELEAAKIQPQINIDFDEREKHFMAKPPVKEIKMKTVTVK